MKCLYDINYNVYIYNVDASEASKVNAHKKIMRCATFKASLCVTSIVFLNQIIIMYLVYGLNTP